jgi:hypothetical protein
MGTPPFVIKDDDGWIGYWIQLHPRAGGFAEALIHLVATRTMEASTGSGVGSDVLIIPEGERSIEVQVDYLIHDMVAVRVFDVLVLRSEGDPLPPWVES